MFIYAARGRAQLWRGCRIQVPPNFPLLVHSTVTRRFYGIMLKTGQRS